jgi:two-component system NarL family sensor kinase
MRFFSSHSAFAICLLGLVLLLNEPMSAIGQQAENRVKEKKDSLLAVLKTQRESDSSYLQTLLFLADWLRNENTDSSIFYAQKALGLALKNNNPRAAFFAHNNLGINYYVKGEYDKSIESFRNYYLFAEKAGNVEHMAHARNNEGNIYLEKGDFEKTISLYQEALKLREQNKDSVGIAMTMANLGYVWKEKGYYQKAIQSLTQASRVYERIQRPQEAATAYQMLGSVYQLKKDFESLKKIAQQSIAILAPTGTLNTLGVSYQQLANAYHKLGQQDSALYYNQKGLEIYEKLNDPLQSSFGYTLLADIALAKNQLPEAEKNLRRAWALQKSINNQRNQGKTITSLAGVLIEQGNIVEANRLLEEALVFIQKTNRKDDRKGWLENKVALLKKQGNAAAALRYADSLNAIKDELLNEENIRAMADVQAFYETEKKEQQLAIQSLEIEKKQTLLKGLVVLIVFLLITAWLLYNRYRWKQKSKLQRAIMEEQDRAARAVIEAEEKERKRIAGDLHDGVGQMMSAARMNLSAFESELTNMEEAQKMKLEKIMALVDESCKEVRSVSHNMMPNALLKAGLASALRDFIEKIDANLIKVDLYSEGLQERIDSNTEIVLYRVIQECVNNVIKHAKASHLDLSLIKEAEGISVTIEDNGIGFNTKQEGKFDGIGLQNIRSRIQFLKGEIDISSEPGKGTLIAIYVPLEKKS